MDANLFTPSFNTSPSGASQATTPASLGSPAIDSPGAALRGADFANLLGSLLANPGRQGLAAAGLAEAGLQSVPLGPQIEVITTAAPLPDTGSLMAFARAQGLDDSTLAALFGDMATSPAAALGTAPAEAQAVAFAVAPAVIPLMAQASPSWWPQSDLKLSPLTVSPSAVSPVAVSSFVLPAPAATAHVLSQNAALAAVAATDVAWQVTQPPAQSLITGATTASAEAPMQVAMQDALRVQLQLPREAVAALTRRLATLSGTGQTQAWGNVAAGAGNAVVADVVDAATVGPATLDLRSFFKPLGQLNEPTAAADAADALPASDADADSMAALPVDGSRKAAGSLTLTPEAVVPNPAGQRAEHYQQLADRLGQALAQRLQAQIERGEWKMQMRMDPASLGRIDLELDMRAGGLDAVFRSDNPLTRELIAQGLPKLRDSLSQSGTAVANVWVNGDSARQSGGNPTPSQTPRRGSQNPSEADDGAGQPLAGAVPVGGVRQGGSSGAWDVLA